MSLPTLNQYILLPQQKSEPFDLAGVAKVGGISKGNYLIILACAQRVSSA